MPRGRGGPSCTGCRREDRWRCCSPRRTPSVRSRYAVFGTHWSWVPEGTDGWKEHHDYLEQVERGWGTEAFARGSLEAWAAPSIADDERAVRWFASFIRRSASPGAAVAYARMNASIDVGSVLASIHVPTLVLARTDDVLFPAAVGRELAARIPGATFTELPGIDHLPWIGDQAALNDAVERFVRDATDSEAELDRVLATVLFTDIVASTERAAELGDRAWAELLAKHDAIVRTHLARFRGREVDTAGDGFFATFDGPIRAARCALAITQSVRELGLEVRAGLHTGEVETANGSVHGIAVVVGARVGALAGASEVLATSTVKDLVAGSSLVFTDHGSHELKGVPERWQVYRVSGGEP